MPENQGANLSPEAQRALAALKQVYATPEDGWFTEEGFRANTYLQVYHPIFEELAQAGHIEEADVYVWKRTNYDK